MLLATQKEINNKASKWHIWYRLYGHSCKEEKSFYHVIRRQDEAPPLVTSSGATTMHRIEKSKLRKPVCFLSERDAEAHAGI